MTRENMFKGLAILGSAFNREISMGMTDVYWAVFGDTPDRAFAHAVDRAVRECEFFPVPAKLRALLPPRDEVAETNRRLDAMKPDPAKLPTPEQFAEMRRDWKDLVGWLTRDKSEPPRAAPAAITEEEKAIAVAKMEADLAAWKARQS